MVAEWLERLPSKKEDTVSCLQVWMGFLQVLLSGSWVESQPHTHVHHSHIQYVVSLKGFGPVSIKDGSSVSLSYNIR